MDSYKNLGFYLLAVGLSTLEIGLLLGSNIQYGHQKRAINKLTNPKIRVLTNTLEMGVVQSVPSVTINGIHYYAIRANDNKNGSNQSLENQDTSSDSGTQQINQEVLKRIYNPAGTRKFR